MSDVRNIAGHAAVTLAVSTSAAQTAPLTAGVYDVWCGVDVFLKVGPVANDVTTANGYKLFANTITRLQIAREGDRIGAIAGGAGTLTYHKTGT